MNQAIQTTLIDALTKIKEKWFDRYPDLYKKQWDALDAVLQDAQKVAPQNENESFLLKKQIVKAIMRIIKKLDKEIDVIEKEMRGLEFFPSHREKLLDKDIEDITFKQAIKKELDELLDRVILARTTKPIHPAF